MAEQNQTILELLRLRPFNSEDLGIDFGGLKQKQERLESQGSSFSPSTIPSSVTDTLTGGDGNDTVNGGDSNDLIDGKNGNDFLDGKEGNDAIAGGRGDDTVIGGSGDDTLYGELASGILRSGSTILTVLYPSSQTEGHNYLDGGDGDDIIIGGSNYDTLMGGNGNDTLSGAQGADTLIGESGHDLINGSYGNDLITGGDGNDTLIGGSDSDTLTGGEGADMFSFSLLFPIGFTSLIRGSQLTPPTPEGGIDTIEDFNALEGDKIQITGVSRGYSPEVSLGQFNYNQDTGILSFENQQFAQLQAGTDFIVDRDVILNIN